MCDALVLLQSYQRSERLQLQELVVTERFKGTAEVGIRFFGIRRRPFDEQFTPEQVSAPGVGVKRARLLRGFRVGILLQSKILFGKHPALVTEVSKGPHD